MTEPLTRRTVLKAAGVAGVAALAGCSGAAETGDGTETETGHHEEGGHGTPTPTHHDHEGHHHGEVEKLQSDAEVRMITTDAGTHFDPHVVWVEEGATVTWINQSGSHTTTAYAPANDRPRRVPEGADAWDSGLVAEEGATFEHTFETPGVYDYYCIPHHGDGMIATVVVGEPDPHGQPGLAEPQERLPRGAREKIRALNERCNELLGHTHEETEGGHHEGSETEGGHHEGSETEGGHHEGSETEGGHHHEDDTETESGHHD